MAIAAVATLVSCQPKELGEPVPGARLVPLTLTAEQSGTRTHIQAEEGGWQPYWNDQDSIFVTLATDLSKAYTFINTSGEGTTGSFSGSIEAEDGDLTIYAFLPKKAGRAEAIFKFETGPEQEISDLSTFDPACDLLVSDALNVTVSGNKAVTESKLHFTRLLAVAKVVVADATTGGKLSGKKIKSVKLTSSGGTLSGKVRVDVTTGAIEGWESGASYNYVTANYSGSDWTADGSTGAFVLVNPVTLASGSTISVEVVTDDDDLLVSRTVSLASPVELKTGEIPTLKFSLTDADVQNKEDVINYTWDFSTPEWQAELAKQAPAANGTNAANWSVSFAGLTYTSGSKNGKWSTDGYIQPNGAGSTTERVFTFTAPSDGKLTVTAATPTKDAVRNVCVTKADSQQVPLDGSRADLVFSVKAGTVNVWPDAGIRFYKLAFTSSGEDPQDPEDPEEPAEDADLDCPNPPSTGTVELDRMSGFAEAAGVTGGDKASAANILHFNDGKALQTWLLARTKSEKAGDHSPVTIWLSGTFGPTDGRDFSEAHPWFDVKDVSNLSFYGTDGFVMDRIGIFCVRANNIIIRNINFQQPKANNGADAVSLQECDGVWVDHCTFTSLNQTKDYEDGSTDITHQSKNVTVSWCRYIKTQKSCLVGHSNSASADVAITATFHHNWFDNSSSRHPRVRFGTAHVYNNLYDGCTTYGAGSAYGAKVLVEYNYFDSVQLPTDICTYPAKDGDVSNLQGSVAGYLYPTENCYVNRPAKARDPYPLSNVKYTKYGGSTITPLTYNDFKPSYSYVVTPVENVPEVVRAGAGYGKLGWTSAPVAVNNGGVSGYNGTGDDPTDPDPDDPDDPDQPAAGLSEGWSWVNNNAAAANYGVDEGRLTISSSGKWESGAQGFGAVLRDVTGDFTATVKLVSYTAVKDGNQGVAGLIVVTGSPSAQENEFLFLLAGKGDKYYRRFRDGVSNSGKSSSSEMSAPGTSGSEIVFMIKRESGSLKACYSLDGGTTFGKVSTFDSFTLPETIKVGVAANSSDNSKQGTAVFADFKINDINIAF